MGLLFLKQVKTGTAYVESVFLADSNSDSGILKNLDSVSDSHPGLESRLRGDSNSAPLATCSQNSAPLFH